MGRRKSGRDIHGVVLLDKPLHLTSNAALQQVRRFFNANRAGHTGALDPLASGLLPLCFGEATKVSHFALEADKTYEVTAQLGIRTTTSDAEGEIVSQQDVAVSQAQVEQVIAGFIGDQQQSPSMFSALKHEGRPLYHYARQGIEVPRKTRPISIRSIRQIDFAGDLLTLEVTCSKGTYIRTLIDDMGQELGCGAHVAQLRRTWIQGVEGPMMSMTELADVAAKTNQDQGDYAAMDALLLPNDAVIQQIPEVWLSDPESSKFLAGNGANVASPIPPDASHVRVRRQSDNALLGIGRPEAGKLQPKRVMNDVPR
ncbi:tRNA pseudouridine(55) synthase TruB [Pseudidiomarina sp.]|uniref:tRNA pseudouridine(55) synthase TruB n=1 Tax=Pseudidiomarina sp. TaxID=2081707 RepID=UPI00299DAA26|nr:tRNA pseudouridine(55) synthase TruB [Pseudidiomarina sp.]MDX1705063.1 tRNA pseudouridine(55) synthase TruB [Pseudidiomarina sp.]